MKYKLLSLVALIALFFTLSLSVLSISQASTLVATLPNDVPRIQWGTFSNDGVNSPKTIVFPQAYVTTPVVFIQSVSFLNSVFPANVTNTGFVTGNMPGGIIVNYFWVAIGTRDTVIAPEFTPTDGFNVRNPPARIGSLTLMPNSPTAYINTGLSGTGAKAASLYISVSTSQNLGGYLRIWNPDSPEPNVASVNLWNGQRGAANTVLTPVRSDGIIAIKNYSNQIVEVYFDLTGYFS